MDNYQLLKLNNSIKSHRIKFAGLWLLSVLNKRYLSLQFDPVLACNLRCKMCYFTDEAYVKKNMKGMMKEEDLEAMAKVNFRHALKLQVGCGAEPTLFKHNTKLIQLAKQYGIPYVSMVTNGNLLSADDIAHFADAGLNEFIFSMHGVYKERYEDLMGKGDYDKFHNALRMISEQKKKSPKLKLRINYTFNEDNFAELADFFEIYDPYDIDVIQLRPIDKIGDTAYDNFSLKKIESSYKELTSTLKKDAADRGTTVLYPESIQREEAESLIVKTQNDSSYLVPFTYCYVSPKFYWKDDFDWRTETFASWQKRNNWNMTLFKNIFRSRASLNKPNRNMLNYSVELN